jgi:hypothetical protein
MRFAAVALALLSVAPFVRATPVSTTAAVWGRLSVVGDRGPVEGAVVRFESSNPRFSVTVASDGKGRFARVGLPPGTYDATISRDGFASVEVVGIVTRPGRRVRLDVELTPVEEAPFARERRLFRDSLVDIESATLEHRTP